MADIQYTPDTPQINTESQQLSHYASITNISSWQEVLDCYAQLKQLVQPKKVFLVLDDLGQASYTSMHATQDEDLYFDSNQYLQDIEDKEWDIVYKNVCLPLELEHYTQQLSLPEHQKSIADFADKMDLYDEDDFKTIIYLNQNPLPALEQELVVKVANVATDALKLAILPNGYFSCDFNPFENFAIIKCLEHYGLEFIGLGAALLGWVKTEYFDPNKIDALMEDLVSIYHFSPQYQQQLRELILTQNYLILPYTESPQEYLDFYVDE